MKNAIQVAGIIDQNEADMLKAQWVEYLWFPLRLTVRTPDLCEEYAAQIIETIKDPYKAVVITYLDQADDIIEFCKKTFG